MQKARLALMVLLVGILPAIAVFAGAWLYFRPGPAPPAPNQPPPPKPLPVVLTASKDLPIGSLITANDIAWSPLRNSAVLTVHMLQGKTQPAQVIGAVVRRPVYKGTPLTWSSIVRPGQHGFLAAALKPDHRAVTIMVNRATSQAGLIYPGDRVDVILTVQVQSTSRAADTFTGTILEDIRVVAVNRQVDSGMTGAAGQPRPSSRAASTVTLEVLPSEAERLVLATSKGDISLAMRSLTDARRMEERPPMAFQDLLALPPEESVAEGPRTPPETATTEPQAAALGPEERPEVRITVFRGGKKADVVVLKRQRTGGYANSRPLP